MLSFLLSSENSSPDDPTVDTNNKSLVQQETHRTRDLFQYLPAENETFMVMTIPLCSINQYLIQMPYCWRTIAPDMVYVQVDWDYKFDYGLYLNPNASAEAKKFFGFVEAYSHDNDTSYLEKLL